MFAGTLSSGLLCSLGVKIYISFCLFFTDLCIRLYPRYLLVMLVYPA